MIIVRSVPFDNGRFIFLFSIFFYCGWIRTSGHHSLKTLPGRRTVPAPVAELFLALGRAQLGAFDDLTKHLRLFAAQLRLAPAFLAPGSKAVAHRPADQVALLRCPMLAA